MTDSAIYLEAAKVAFAISAAAVVGAGLGLFVLNRMAAVVNKTERLFLKWWKRND